MANEDLTNFLDKFIDNNSEESNILIQKCIKDKIANLIHPKVEKEVEKEIENNTSTE